MANEEWILTTQRRAIGEHDQESKALFNELTSRGTKEAEISVPKKGLDEQIEDIFKQAYDHRSLLVKFYVIYTICMSLVVVSLVCAQAWVRLTPGYGETELVPGWALNFLVVGMFGQFIGLLTIVTKKVWTYEPFFQYGRESSKRRKKDE